jgi:DNA-binding NtrC family response regulator
METIKIKHKLLVVEDSSIERELIKHFLEQNGFQVDAVASGNEALVQIQLYSAHYSVIILDYNLSDGDGTQVTKEILKINPTLAILVYSADRRQEPVIQSTRNGARVFVGKSEGAEIFLREINKLCREFELERATVGTRSRSENETLIQRIGMVGCSPELAKVAETVVLLRDKTGPVLILGESGTGKELVARALKRPGPFKAVNCAGFWMNLNTAYSELFGHVKGSFTGADQSRPGIFETARGGTVFLDEIYSLPMEAQVAILRALQEKTITRLGSSEEIRIDCRIIAAAKPDLVELTEKGAFKKDLYYRISENVIFVPPLNQRTRDIAILVDYFCKKWSTENNQEKTFLTKTIPILESYSWPGNVNELRNVVYNTLNTSRKSRIGVADLSQLNGNSSLSTNGSLHPLRAQYEKVERELLIKTLKVSKSIRETARRLGISPQSVLRKLKKEGISANHFLGTDFISANDK